MSVSNPGNILGRRITIKTLSDDAGGRSLVSDLVRWLHRLESIVRAGEKNFKTNRDIFVSTTIN
jgi:hypothetical protein